MLCFCFDLYPASCIPSRIWEEKSLFGSFCFVSCHPIELHSLCSPLQRLSHTNNPLNSAGWLLLLLPDPSGLSPPAFSHQSTKNKILVLSSSSCYHSSTPEKQLLLGVFGCWKTAWEFCPCFRISLSSERQFQFEGCWQHFAFHHLVWGLFFSGKLFLITEQPQYILGKTILCSFTQVVVYYRKSQARNVKMKFNYIVSFLSASLKYIWVVKKTNLQPGLL